MSDEGQTDINAGIVEAQRLMVQAQERVAEAMEDETARLREETLRSDEQRSVSEQREDLDYRRRLWGGVVCADRLRCALHEGHIRVHPGAVVDAWTRYEEVRRGEVASQAIKTADAVLEADRARFGVREAGDAKDAR